MGILERLGLKEKNPDRQQREVEGWKVPINRSNPDDPHAYHDVTVAHGVAWEGKRVLHRLVPKATPIENFPRTPDTKVDVIGESDMTTEQIATASKVLSPFLAVKSKTSR
jgi:hypothetical protein